MYVCSWIYQTFVFCFIQILVYKPDKWFFFFLLVMFSLIRIFTAGRHGRPPDSGDPQWSAEWSARPGGGDKLQLGGSGGLRLGNDHKLTAKQDQIWLWRPNTMFLIDMCYCYRTDLWGSLLVYPFIANGLRRRWQTQDFVPVVQMLIWSPKREEEKIRGRGRNTIEGSIMRCWRTLFKILFKIFLLEPLKIKTVQILSAWVGCQMSIYGNWNYGCVKLSLSFVFRYGIFRLSITSENWNYYMYMVLCQLSLFLFSFFGILWIDIRRDYSKFIHFLENVGIE